MNAPSLFPAFLKLAGKRCLVVGGGPVATSKLNGLLQAGAEVTIVAPEATVEIRELVRAGRIRWEDRPFQVHDLDRVSLVVAATGDDAVNEQVFRGADRRNILCNAVDEPERCHFYYPAVVQRGALQIAISTAGLSPLLAQRLRKELEAQFEDEYAPWTEWLGRVRSAMIRRGTDFQSRRQVLAKLASRDGFQRWLASHARKALGKGAAT